MNSAITTLTIYNPIGGALCTLPVTNSCDRSYTLGGDNKITLNCKFAKRYAIPAFSYVRYDGELFFVKELYMPQPMGGYYQYELSFFSVLNMLYKPLFKRYVTVEGSTFDEPEFDVNANLATIGEMLITAINKYAERVPNYRGQTTIFAQCLAAGKFRLADNSAYNDTTLQAFSFSGTSILDAINMVAQTYETEFWCVPSSGVIPTYTLRLEKCEQGDIITLSNTIDNATRKSGGLISAEYSSEFGDVPQVFLPIGSDRNITRKVAQQTVNGNLMNVSYAKRLKLDPSTTYAWTDDAGTSVSITTDAAGAIAVDGVTTGIETTETFDDIYPKCCYRVTEVVTRGSADNPYYKVMFEAIGGTGLAAPYFPFTIADGATLSIIFESGLLNGMEFEVQQGDGGNGVMGLTIIPNGDDESAQIPYGSFVPMEGDEFAVFNIIMPEEYVELAKLELAKAAYTKVCEYRDTRPDLSCKSEPNYFHENGVEISMGCRVAVESELIGDLQYLSRVSEFSYSLASPDDVSFKLSSAVQAGSLAALKLAVADATNSVNGLQQRSIVLSRRGWRDQKELSEMIESLASEMMLIGNEKYQFGLTSTISILNTAAGAFSAVKFTAGALSHTQPPYRDNGNNGLYEMPAATYYKSNISGYDAATPYYIYAVLDSSTAKGTWLITPTAQDGEMYMLVGVLASEFENQRTFSRTYGYTAVTGGKITTEMIQDAGSNLIIDFQSNPPRIVARNGAEIIGNIKFKASDTKTAEEYIAELVGGVATAQSTADAAQAEAETVREEYQEAISAEEQARNSAIAGVQTSIGSLQNQIDGEVTAWFLNGVPTLTNAPAVDWTTDDEKTRHIGDTYTNMNTYDDDPDAGKSWRWCKGANDDFETSGDSIYTGANPLTITAQASDNYNHVALASNLSNSSQILFSCDKAVVKAGSATQFTVGLYDLNQSKSSQFTALTIGENKVEKIFTVPDTGTWYLIIYAGKHGSTAGVSMEYTNIKIWYGSVKNSWHWHLIADSDAVKALVEAGKAQSTADGKSTTFIVQPSNYQKGDLWILQTDSDHTAGKKGDILTANADSTTYVASHWSKEVKYTDDTAIDNLQIGGRNLLLNSNSYTWYTWATSWASGVTNKYTATKTDEYSQYTINTKPTNALSTFCGVFHKITNALWAGRKVTVSAMLYSSYQDTVKIGFVEEKDSTKLLNQYNNHNADIAVEAQKWTQVSWSFESPIDLYADVNGQTPNALYVVIGGSVIPEAGSYWRMKNVKIEFGNKPTDWTPAPEDVEVEIAALDYLKAALNDGSTEIAGGLLMTNVLMLKNLAGAVTAGMSGLTKKTGTSIADNVLLWGGGTYEEAFYAANNANYYKAASGTTPITTLIKKDGTGKIGVFKISSTQITVDVPNQGKIVIDGSTSNAGIYIQDTNGENKAVFTPRSISGSDFPKDDATSTKTYSISANGALTGSFGSFTSNTFTVRSTTNNADQTQTITKSLKGTATFSMNIDCAGGLIGSSGTTYQAVIRVTSSNSFAAKAVKVISTTVASGYTGTKYLAGSLDFDFSKEALAGDQTLTVNVTTAINGEIDAKIGFIISGQTTLPLASGTRSVTLSATYTDTVVTKYIYKPKTIIGKDGMVCALSKDCYFMTRLGVNAQEIIFRGLPTTAPTTAGQLYNDGGTVKIKT